MPSSASRAAAPPPALGPALHTAAAAAAAVSMLAAYQRPPVTTFVNQIAALGLWGVFVLVAASAGTGRLRHAARDTAPLLAVFVAVAGFAAASSLFGTLPGSLARLPIGALAAAAVMTLAGAAAMASPHAVVVRRAFLGALVLAGVGSAAVAAVQVFVPAWTDRAWLAATTLTGRAVGNLRQPNHLATLLLWATIALVPLAGGRALPRALAGLLMAALVGALALTGSRTGTLGVLLLGLWGLVDRRLGRFERGLLLAAPLGYALVAAALWWDVAQGGAAMGAATRVGEADLSSSRFAIWTNTLTLIGMHPWAGVGHGRFNLAWTLTPFQQRPVAFFDHTHDLPLQFAVEYGVPAALALVGLLLWALWQGWRRSRDAGGSERQALWMMVLLVALHSLLEYPLWYMHFLLPAAWAFGAAMARARGSAEASPTRRPSPVLALAGGAMLVAALFATADYLRVSRIFSASPGAAPLAQRIADGQRAWLFAHHADYAAATVTPAPATVMPAIERAAHHLLDTRLMIAWATALADDGDLERARHLAQRLREFRRPESRTFFAACAAEPAPGGPVSEPPSPPLDDTESPRFACEVPRLVFNWRDFVH